MRPTSRRSWTDCAQSDAPPDTDAACLSGRVPPRGAGDPRPVEGRQAYGGVRPLGRLAFALTSYLYAFFSNVHAATVTRTMRDYQLYKDTGSSTAGAAANAIGRAAS